MDESRRHYDLGRIAIGILCLLAAACAGPPSVDDVERVLRHRLSQNANGRLEIVSVRQTNAQEGEVMGVSMYSIEYEVEVEVTEAAYWQRRDPLSNEILFLTESATAGSGGAGAQLMLGASGYRPFPNGHRETLKGELVFEKTEKGWRTTAGELLSELSASRTSNRGKVSDAGSLQSTREPARSVTAALESDIERLGPCQDQALATYGWYVASRRAVDCGSSQYQPSPGTWMEVITVGHGPTQGWAAIMTHQAGARCIAWHGIDDAREALAERVESLAPSSSPGDVVCGPATTSVVASAVAGALKEDLRCLAGLQEIYYNDEYEYSDGTFPADWRPCPASPDATLEIIHASSRSWAATASDGGVTCGIWYGANDGKTALAARNSGLAVEGSGGIVCDAASDDAPRGAPATASTKESTPQLSEDRVSTAYRAALKSDLLNLQSLQDGYHSTHGEYTSDLAVLDMQLSAGVRIDVLFVSADGWAAIATHRNMEVSCGIWRGSADARAALSERLVPLPESLAEGRANCNG